MRESERVPWERNIRHGEDVNKENAEKLLFDLLDLLDEHNITYWFNWGLLLGAIREKDFIVYDTDMDITCHIEDRPYILEFIEPVMAKKGCYIPLPGECFLEDRWFIRDKEKIELNYVEPVKDKYIYSPGRCSLGCPKSYIDKLDAIEFRGRIVNIPSNVKKYLELSYGKDWETPIRDKKPKSL